MPRVQLVEQFVGALEGADPAQVGRDHDGGQCFGHELPGPSVDLGVAEAVEGEGGFEHVLGTFPLVDIAVRDAAMAAFMRTL